MKRAGKMMMNKDAPIHPGEILAEEFLQPLQISPEQLAKDMYMPARRIRAILQGLHSINAETALRWSRYFGLSERFWLNLQTSYDLEVEKDKLADRLTNEIKVLAGSHVGG